MKLIVEKLNLENRKILRENITQPIAMYLSVLLVAIILLGAIYIAATNDGFPKLHFNALWIFWGTSILFIIIYCSLLFRALRIPILDLLKGDKIIQYKKIIEKSKNKKYTASMDPIVDFKKQPVLEEYFFKFNEYELPVNSKVYELFHEGDEVKLSLSFYSNKVIQIERSNNFIPKLN